MDRVAVQSCRCCADRRGLANVPSVNRFHAGGGPVRVDFRGDRPDSHDRVDLAASRKPDFDTQEHVQPNLTISDVNNSGSCGKYMKICNEHTLILCFK